MPSGTVTFLFTDVEGSTRRWDAHPTSMQMAMARHDSILNGTISAHGGSVFTTAGDAFCSAFSSPTQAIAAAVAIQIALAGEDWGDVAPFRVRAALHSGNADERDGDYFGPPLNRCARLLSLAHGGQILVSGPTAHLVAGSLPPGVALEDLGPHELKDLDRPEHVFWVRHADLRSDVGELRSGSSTFESNLERGRRAHANEEWEASFTAFRVAAELGDLDAWDQHRYAETAYWTGRMDEAISLRESAYAKLLAIDEREAAALAALDLAFFYKYRLAGAIAKAWVARAEQLVSDEEGTLGHGYLLRWYTTDEIDRGEDPERAVELAERVIATGVAIGDRSLQALGLMDKGRVLVTMGRIDEGMALVDESMISAVAGEINADATGRNYCNMLSVCDQIADYQRAAEWSDAAEAWCTQHSDSAYPGICRIYRAELKWLRGDWQAATVDLHRAMDELSGFTPIIGAALYQIGEVELRAGNLVAAEERFRAANEHAFPPLPGMAVLRMVQGDAAGCEQLLVDAIANNPQPLFRARLLPALIDAQVELGKVDEADANLRELGKTAELCDSTAMRAEVADRQTTIAMASDDPKASVQAAQVAIGLWSSLQMPYEAAKSRLRLASAHAALGNDAAATMETDTAQATLNRLRTDVPA